MKKQRQKLRANHRLSLGQPHNNRRHRRRLLGKPRRASAEILKRGAGFNPESRNDQKTPRGNSSGGITPAGRDYACRGGCLRNAKALEGRVQPKSWHQVREVVTRETSWTAAAFS